MLFVHYYKFPYLYISDTSNSTTYMTGLKIMSRNFHANDTVKKKQFL